MTCVAIRAAAFIRCSSIRELADRRDASRRLLQAASMPEIRALARDIGVEAGTQTKENIRNLALRPAAQACFAANGVPQVK